MMTTCKQPRKMEKEDKIRKKEHRPDKNIKNDVFEPYIIE